MLKYFITYILRNTFGIRQKEISYTNKKHFILKLNIFENKTF